MAEIEAEKNIQIKNQKMELLGAAIQSNNLEEAQKYLDLFPKVKSNPTDELRKELDDVKQQLAGRTTTIRNDSMPVGTVDHKTQLKARIATGRAIMEYIGKHPTERVELRATHDDYIDKIPDYMLGG